MANKKFYKRSFLNKTEGSAVIETKCNHEHEFAASATLKITDCNHTVNIDLDFWDPKLKAEKKYKLDKLISELEAFRTALFPVQAQKE
jgi:hypothetical protein